MKSPKLRFRGFETSWSSDELGNYVKVQTGPFGSQLHEKDYVDEGTPIITVEHFGDNKVIHNNLPLVSDEDKERLKKYSLIEGDIVFSRVGSIDRRVLISKAEDGWLFSGRCLRLRVSDESLNSHYLSYFLGTNKCLNEIRSKAVGGTMPSLNTDILNSIRIFFPEINEQMKISNFMGILDKKIYLQQEKIDLLKEQKKGYMQKIFSRELRFKDEDGREFPEWTISKLSKLLYEHKVRNFEKKYNKNDVLSVSGEHGIVNQIEFQGRSFAGVSVDNYHIVHQGDIVYTKSPLKKNPFGIIKFNGGKPGIVSTLYAVYSCKTGVNPKYLDYYFQLDVNTNNYLKPLVNKGAKNDMKVNNEAVLQGYITYPCFQEQNKITDFLSTLDEKIHSEVKKLDMLLKQKQAFMQRMFV